MAKTKFPTTPDAINAIFNEAIPLFALSGFSGVSMRHIAKAVGISIATLYHHFSDKQNLYLRCIEEAFANKAEGLSKALSQQVSPEEQLREFININMRENMSIFLRPYISNDYRSAHPSIIFLFVF